MTWPRGARLALHLCMIDLHSVGAGEAGAAVRRTFDRVRDALALPWVPDLYRSFAAWPALLDIAWQAAAPRVRTRAFLGAAEALAASARAAASFYRPAFLWHGDAAAVERV